MKHLLLKLNLVLLVAAVAISPCFGEDEEDLTAALEIAKKVVGPDKGENNCATCHALEAEAWLNTRHFATFKDRHRSPEAKAILEKLEIKSMKRSGACFHCHYTNEEKNGKLSASWGVSCESCHNPGKDWLETHYKPGGDLKANNIKWGEGKKGDPEARKKRLAASQAKGMIHSTMLYEIAKNCYGCHTVPDEGLVNKGGHKAGSDFDLVSWSQGEIRHNFCSSPGAPDAPTNRAPTAEHLRRMLVVGTMVDLEHTLINLTSVKEKGGAFHKAMLERANKMRKKCDELSKAVEIPELAAALKDIPAEFTADAAIDAAWIKSLSDQGKAFVENHDGSKLGALDAMVPASDKYHGKAYEK